MERIVRSLDRRPALWLGLGILLIAASQLRWGIGGLAWVAPIPWIRWLRLQAGRRTRWAFGPAMWLAWTLAVASIITAPLSPAMAPMFALPMAVGMGAPFLIGAALRSRVGPGRAALGFSAAAVLGEWLLHVLTPFASWGAAAYTQGNDLPLLQSVSVFGLHGIAFFMAWVAALAEEAVDARVEGRSFGLSSSAVAGLGVFVLLHVGGSVRLLLADAAGEETVLVAAVSTDSTAGGLPLPSEEETAGWDAGLFERTRAAAAAGAELVVWPEAGTVVRPEAVEGWMANVSGLARELEIEVVAALVVPLPGEALRYENRYAWFAPDGTLRHDYFKHEPVPGEPAVKGTGPMPIVESAFGRLSGAICYDYDFPRLALEQARAGVDLVALPSSDWRGIDPLHTRMAGVRGIEGGHSILRSTRWGLSAGIDPYGRMRGRRSDFDTDDRFLLVRLPKQGVRTLYSVAGDWFPLLCLLGLLGLAGVAVRARVAAD